MLAVDTNVLVRLLARDVTRRAAAHAAVAINESVQGWLGRSLPRP
jgi:predicted nucleic acid-binding protein